MLLEGWGWGGVEYPLTKGLTLRVISNQQSMLISIISSGSMMGMGGGGGGDACTRFPSLAGVSSGTGPMNQKCMV